MLSIHIKYQLRQGSFLIPLLILPFFWMYHHYLWVFLLLQHRFFRQFENRDFHLPLVYITGVKLKRYLMAYNMSWILWYNIWFAVMKISISFYSINNTPVNMEEFLDFNILLFIAFMVGNMISNSFLITIQRFILRFLISSSLFCLIMVASYFLINQVPPGEMFFQLKCLGLVLCIAIWHETIKKQKTIKYIEYYFS